jgi:hypothetical protein|tara:strand:+ start:55 stop:399 length:345 start_codon:yes stop_codon:yes gene_type:complete
MNYIKVFVSSTKANELLTVIDGITKQMMIPVRMSDSGVAFREWDSSAQTDDCKMWIKFEVCDDSLSWESLKDRVDQLNNHGKYAGGKSGWSMPCEIELYGFDPEGYEIVHTNED